LGAKRCFLSHCRPLEIIKLGATSASHAGGSVTGFAGLNIELSGKLLRSSRAGLFALDDQ